MNFLNYKSDKNKGIYSPIYINELKKATFKLE